MSSRQQRDPTATVHSDICLLEESVSTISRGEASPFNTYRIYPLDSFRKDKVWVNGMGQLKGSMEWVNGMGQLKGSTERVNGTGQQNGVKSLEIGI